MRFINTCPHEIKEITSNTVFPPDPDNQVRVQTERDHSHSVSLDTELYGSEKQVAIYKKTYGALSYTPPVKEGVIYIVSVLVKQACPDRSDFVSPSDLFRNNRGEVIGCKGFDL